MITLWKTPSKNEGGYDYCIGSAREDSHDLMESEMLSDEQMEELAHRLLAAWPGAKYALVHRGGEAIKIRRFRRTKPVSV